MANNFLPAGFEKLKTEKPYVNLSKLPEGEHRFRIVDRPIAGWVDWKDKKPYRFKPENKPAQPFDLEKPIKAFWALHVWDYQREGLFVMEITQGGIRKALEDLAKNEDWGDLTSFDVKIKKEGNGKDTSYTVIPVPPKPMSANIKKAVSQTKVRLEALYEGRDPWNDLEAIPDIDVPAAVARPNNADHLTEEQCAHLDVLLLDLEIEDTHALLDVLGLDSIHHVNPKDFDRVVRSINKKIKEIHDSIVA